MNNCLLKIKGLFKSGFFHILTGEVLNKGILLITSIVLVRLLDKTTYAYLAYADNLYSYIGLLSGFGLSYAVLRVCLKRNSPEENLAYVKFSISRGFFINICLSLLLFIAVLIIEIPYPEARTYILMLLLYQSLTHVLNTITSYMRSNMLNKQYAKTGIIHSILMLAANIGITLAIGRYGFVLARYVAVVLAIIIAVMMLRPYVKNIKRIRLTSKQSRYLVRVGISLMLANFFSGIMPVNEMFLVNNLIADEVITANFKVAGILPQLLIVVTSAINIYFFSIVVNLSDRKTIRKIVVKAGIVNAVVIFILAGGGALFSPVIIKIVYGNEYINAVGMSYVLWLMRAVNAAFRAIPMNMMPAIGKEKTNAVILAVSCIVQTVMDYFFIKNIGVWGAAYGAITVYTVSGLLYWVLFFFFTGKGYREIEKIT